MRRDPTTDLVVGVCGTPHTCRPSQCIGGPGIFTRERHEDNTPSARFRWMAGFVVGSRYKRMEKIKA
jgi:hypothetical protein